MIRNRIAVKELPRIMRSMTKKRQCTVTLLPNGGSVTPYGYFWEGGSRNEYIVMDARDGTVRRPPVPSSPFSGEEMQPITFKVTDKGVPREVIITSGHFCGKEATMNVAIPHALALLVAGIEWPDQMDPMTPASIVRDWLEEFRPDDCKKFNAFYGTEGKPVN